MLREIFELLWATKVFIFVRAVLAMIIAVLYLIVAAAIQYWFVSIFGESTFNYIVGGIFSLGAGIAICGSIGKFLFMFVRGWHVGAIVYSKQILERNLPALEVGMAVFKKHLTSFAAVYGISMILSKFTKGAVGKLWELMDDVPFVSSLKKVAEWPLVRRLGEDILNTSFDCIIYYLAKYSKSGIRDDFSKIPEILKTYLYALPGVAGTSIAWFFLSWVAPKFLRVFLCIYVFKGGIVSGILLNVLLFPLFYVIANVLFEPIRTVLFLSAFAARCKEDPAEDCPYMTIVEGIMEALGLDGVFEDAKQAMDEAKQEKKSRRRRRGDVEEEATSEPVKKATAAAKAAEDKEEELEEDGASSVFTPATPPHKINVGTADLASLLDGGPKSPLVTGSASPTKARADSRDLFVVPSVEPSGDEDEDEDTVPRMSSLNGLLNASMPKIGIGTMLEDMDAEGDTLDDELDTM